MGTTTCIAGLTLSDWVNIACMLFSSVLALLLIYVVQARQTDIRCQKNESIENVKKIRQEYHDWLHELRKESTKNASVLRWFKHMAVKVGHYMKEFNQEYAVPIDMLEPYTTTLLMEIVDSHDFMVQYPSGVFRPGDELHDKLLRFQEKHGHLFQDLIRLINKA
jgi:hypothetical protein